jgi:hypothetical protein
LKKALLLLIFLGTLLVASHATTIQPIEKDTLILPIPTDTVRAGIYITSIHNIDFREKEYTIDLWLWLRYKNHSLDFYQNLEVPQAKTVIKSFATIDSSDGQIYLLMKLQCVMNDSWRINNFPFDSQTLRFAIENSQFDKHAMVFVVDTLGKQFDPRFTLSGWNINKLSVSSEIKKYETAFGDKTIPKPHTEYSSFITRIKIGRHALGLFWKMFLGMYVAFLTAFACFYIHLDNSDSRFGLAVGSLFAVIGNKYIVEASLPESVTFTLVDMLHGVTLVFILIVIVCNVISLNLYKKRKNAQVARFNSIAGKLMIVAYILINIFFIGTAIKGS